MELLYSMGHYFMLAASSNPQEGEPWFFEPFFAYLVRRWDRILVMTLEHFELILVATAIAIAIGVTVGVIISYYEPIAYPVINVTQVLMTIPSIAMIAMLIPLFGIGFNNGVAALVLYMLLPLVRNTYTGIREIEPAVLESAKGMGMSELRVLTKIKLPLALPVIMAGIRVAVVLGVGIGAIAAYIGAGGLGSLIFNGIERVNYPMIWTGAIFISIIAIVLDLILGWGEKRLYRY